MKKSYKSIKSSIAVLLTLLSANLLAAPVALITQVSGNVFMKTDGKIAPVYVGTHVDDFSEIMSEVGGAVTFVDYFDHEFSLAGAGHVGLLNRIVELKRGYLWLKSVRQGSEEGMVKTTNAKVLYNKGEYVISFDQEKRKTQALSVSGNFRIANLMMENLYTEVSTGQFSFIEDGEENGTPRFPTMVGKESYKRIASLFNRQEHDGSFLTTNEIEQLAQTSNSFEINQVQDQLPSRKIASFEEAIKEQAPSSATSGKVLYVKKKEMPKSNFNLKKYYQTKVTAMAKKMPAVPFRPTYDKQSGVPFNVYWPLKQTIVEKVVRTTPVAKVPTVSEESKRAPASVVAPDSNTVNAFESSLMKEYKNQMRHNQEVNSLIDELRSFKQDLKKEY